MRKFLSVVLLSFIIFSLNAQVKYEVHANLNTKERQVNGYLTVHFVNNTDFPVSELWFHLYPNAFKNDKTAYTNYSLLNRDTRFYFSSSAERGFLNGLDWQIDAQKLMVNYDSVSNEFVGVKLPKTLERGDSCEIKTPFFVKLPYQFDVMGYRGDSIFLVNWFPQLCLMNQDGTIDKMPFTSYDAIKNMPANTNVHLTIDDIDSTVLFFTQQEDAPLLLSNEQLCVLTEAVINRYLRATQWIDNYFRLPKLFKAKMPKDLSRFLLAIYEQAGKGQPIVQQEVRTRYQKFLFERVKAKIWIDSVSKTCGTPTKDALDSIAQHQSNFLQDECLDLYGRCLGRVDTSFFSHLYNTTSLYPCGIKRMKPTFLFNLKETDKYNYISFAPAVGYNYYDKWMFGGLIHNYQLPLNKFNFLVAPMYSSTSNSLRGLAQLTYNIFKPKDGYSFSVHASSFAYNSVQNIAPESLVYSFNRIVPTLKWIKYLDAVNEKKWMFTLRDYWLQFSGFSLKYNPITKETNYTSKKAYDNIIETQVEYADGRVLYPFSGRVTMQANYQFAKVSFLGKYFFNYDASDRGVNVRLFAGKFMYLNGYNEHSSLKGYYYLNLSGVSGYHDYTFSHYFMSRMQQQGWQTQQIVERDGFFKVAMPMRYNPVGESDDWIGAINFTADIPKAVDPFKMLPFRVPVKIFADIGSYAEAWQPESEVGKFVYDAGVQISLFNDALNIYLPLIYSRVYKDYYQSIYGRQHFWKTVKFSFNLAQLIPKNFYQILPL